MNGLTTYKLIADHFDNKPFSTQDICDKIRETTSVIYQRAACSVMLNSLYKEELLTKDERGVFRRRVISPVPSRSHSFVETGRAVFEYIESLKTDIKTIEDLEEENIELRKQAEKFKGFGGHVSIPGMKA